MSKFAYNHEFPTGWPNTKFAISNPHKNASWGVFTCSIFASIVTIFGSIVVIHTSIDPTLVSFEIISSTSIYDLVLIYLCHFHHHYHLSITQSNLTTIEIFVLLSWIPASKEFWCTANDKSLLTSAKNYIKTPLFLFFAERYWVDSVMSALAKILLMSSFTTFITIVIKK